MQYFSRFADQVLEDSLQLMGGVLLEGPRACGKTSTALQKAASSVRLDRSPELITLAELNPAILLNGPTPRLIDEWQLAPSIWNTIRHEIDDRQGRGEFILSGSAAPADDTTRHSGAGRFARLRMRPMSLAESGASTNQVSLAELQPGVGVSGVSKLTYKGMAEQAVRGGWPGLLGTNTQQAVMFNRSYLDNVFDVEVPESVGTRHNQLNIRRTLESIARNISGEATLKTLAADVSSDATTVDPKTVSTYLQALTRIFILDELQPWSVALRSKSRLRTSPKLHLADPSLACAALGIGVDRLAKDPEFFGQIFESMVIRDLRAASALQHGHVYHYRDNTGLEVDAIIEYPEDGKWGACEVKLGASQIPQAEANLIKLRDERVDTNRVGSPAYLAIITATEYAYTLPSGVHVIPLGTLTA
ncbi:MULTISPECIES: ATP-binding protein [Corynebacterium]|uniref:ATP-binding protein n=1 Tax=Corynebacterium gottingense TaxID=2041036 RepID=A0ABX9UHM0_9CORY|nr:MULTISPECIES: DUF4143 domain-containing protein [Corynebacterium]RMD18331.1 ATP-binding protein [Corynebacterium gottingense]TVX81610.1 ATP-binding protein [Corynebacterium sp. NML180780]